MQKKSKKKKRVVILIIVIAAVAIFAVAGISVLVKKSMENVSGTFSRVQLEEVRKQDLSEFISLSGTVTGETKTNYSSSAAAEIAELKVEVGDKVKKGDVLVVLDQDTIQSQIDLMEKSMANAAALSANQSRLNKKALKDAKKDRKKQISQAKEALSSAKKEYKAAKKDYEQLKKTLAGLKEERDETEDPDERSAFNEQIKELQTEVKAAKEMADAAKAAWKEADDSYDSVKEAADEAVFAAQNTVDMEKYADEGDNSEQKELENLKKQLDQCTIKSRGNGIVTAVNVSVGDVNTPDSPIITVENDQTMILTASVGETDILKLQEGMKAVVTADALGDQEIQGEIVKVVKVFDGSAAPPTDMGGEMTAAETSGGFSVQIRLEKSDLISGMSAKAKIILTERPDVLCVPYDLVKKDESGKSYILCAENQGDGVWKSVKKSIETGEEIDYFTEVTGGEVSEGDYVVLDANVFEGENFQADISLKDAESKETEGK